MDNSTIEKDPWANMGNMAPGNKAGEVSQEGLEREAKWNSVMSDAPEFNSGATSETNGTSAEDAENRDENIADASAIINYGLNAAAKEKSVEAVIQTINNFVFNGTGDPIKQLFIELGIDNEKDTSDLKEESYATKLDEDAYRKENINAPVPTHKSINGALEAISEVKNLVAEVETSPDYANLRTEAMVAGKGIFEYAVSKYNVRDLTVLFKALSEYKQQPTTSESTENKKDIPPEDQPENKNSIL